MTICLIGEQVRRDDGSSNTSLRVSFIISLMIRLGLLSCWIVHFRKAMMDIQGSRGLPILGKTKWKVALLTECGYVPLNIFCGLLKVRILLMSAGFTIFVHASAFSLYVLATIAGRNGDHLCTLGNTDWLDLLLFLCLF